MAKSHEHRIPEWVAKEREGDLAWIRENLHIFWPAAQQGYQTIGRGAIVVDTTSRPTGAGHPFGYLDKAAIEHNWDEDTQRLIREYEPSWEFVTSMLKPRDRVSSYRVGVLSAKPREDLDSRAATSDVDEPQEQTQSPGQATTREVEPPDLETLKAWEAEGYCEAVCPHHCIVEPDGTCPHGCNSWLLELGLI